MMTRSFVSFRHLPRELREEIWKLAVRPDRPEVQVFYLSWSRQDETHAPGILPSPWTWAKHYRLSAPGRALSQLENVFERQTMAESTYLTDRGLWMACKESRHVIRRELRVRSGSSPTEAPAANIQVPIIYRTSNPLQGHCLNVCPDRDLFVFRLEASDPCQSSSYGVGRIKGSEYWGLKIRHVAWEYDPFWAWKADDQPGCSVFDYLCSFLMYGSRDGNLETLWLINYNVRRKHWVPSEEEAEKPPPRTFETGKHRLIQAELADGRFRNTIREGCAWAETIVEKPEPSGRDFVTFANLLQDLAFLGTGHSRISVGFRPISIGILACEDGV